MARQRVDTTSPVDWRYTAEGGANLVLSYAGKARPDLKGHALRQRKRKRVAGPEGAIPDQVDSEFGDNIIRPLLGQELCLDAQVVPLSSGWLQSMADSLAVRKVRPPKRVQEDEIDVAAGQGVLVEDLIAGLGSLSVEIKPKWGFLPSPSHLSPATANVKTAYCRTCMHRALKRAPRLPVAKESGPASKTDGNEFCPLDLYSRDRARISRALKQLYSSWSDSDGGINNLRLFLDGKLVKPSELPPQFNETMSSSTASYAEPASGFASLFTPILLASPVLPRLAALQSSLDPLDIEGLATRVRHELGLDLYRPDLAEDEVASALGGQPTMQEWQTWLGRWQERTTPTPTTRSSERETPLRDLILAYLLSATFKDCSIFLRLDWPPPSYDIASTSSAGQLRAIERVKIKVIDLDPKPIARMGKYARMDREVVAHWRDSVLANSALATCCAKPL